MMSRAPKYRVLELLVMPGCDREARDEARRLGVPDNVQPKVGRSNNHARAYVYRWEWQETEIVTWIDESLDTPI